MSLVCFCEKMILYQPLLSFTSRVIVYLSVDAHLPGSSDLHIQYIPLENLR